MASLEETFKSSRELCGDSTLANVIIITNIWGEVTPEIGSRREQQLATDNKFFAPAIAAGSKMLRHLNTKQSAEAILHEIIHNTPLPFRIQEEIVDEGRNLDETAAGGVLFKDLKALEEKHQKEKEEMRRKIEAANAQAKEELRQKALRREKDVRRLQEDMRKLMQDLHEDMTRENERRDRERQADRQE